MMTRRFVVPTVVGVTFLMLGFATWRDARKPVGAAVTPMSLVAATTRADLEDTVARAERRLVDAPDDGEAVVQLAQALIRLQRVTNDAGAVVAAEQRLRAFLARRPDHYESQRALGSVLLSQHRFHDAIREAEKARTTEPRDAWNYGVIGDGRLELGDYDAAFEAFDRMGALRPGPSSYARVAYALELKGDLEGALDSMRMAADATSAHDAEGQAWHYAQLGNLMLQRGRLGDARREFERAAFTFPDHPYALSGIARIKIAEGEYRGALAIYEKLLSKAPTPEIAALAGDLEARLGRHDRAEWMYLEAERLEREGWATEEPQPQALARFLAERGRKIPEAVSLAEQATAKRRDVDTMDALAWAAFQAGRLEKAVEAAKAAVRLGTRDPRILYHAAVIMKASGNVETARALLQRIEAPSIDVDLLVSPRIRALMAELQLG